MGQSIIILLPITPVPKGRARVTRSGQCYTPAKTRNNEHDLRLWLRRYYLYPPLASAVAMDVEIGLLRPKSARKRKYPSVKPDADNYAKQILDASNGILFLDDSLVCKLSVMKCYSPNIYTRITLTEMT